MEKQNSLTQFQELNSSELNQITGGDWWSEMLNFNRSQKYKHTSVGDIRKPIKIIIRKV
ncbi:ComC/BlpC family leader-containing pheromone/bacteriocin [Streptococcus equi]|uniref:ComC/BlpC family leader-containing pheromone/bacteriocin n=1 Tax=Streptococcus equi TaxID=1336 RepID=UPI0013F69A34|nr:ComC/BlpC family leader-containing pheromone/bacteriocin [Streptococcus equi]MCD3391230.1 ComC/BlpC family leader-containing pheromone/bacteriocin [Streptococcus equi subsp. zooepidemicus]